ncbi:hypothetical protein PGB90_007996 [Kerria lacca]
MSSNSPSYRVNDRLKERTRFTITTNGTPFGQYRGIVFLSQLDPNTRKVWINKSMDESTDEITIGPLHETNTDIRNTRNTNIFPRNEAVIFIQNEISSRNENVSEIEPDYNYGHYNQ